MLETSLDHVHVTCPVDYDQNTSIVVHLLSNGDLLVACTHSLSDTSHCVTTTQSQLRTIRAWNLHSVYLIKITIKSGLWTDELSLLPLQLAWEASAFDPKKTFQITV